MSERLTGGLAPEALAALAALELDEPVTPFQREADKIPLKDQPYVDLLHAHPELGAAITGTMTRLVEEDREVPVLHVTSRAVRLPDGTEQSTGYLENIGFTGLRARDTNVAAMMQRGATTSIGSAAYFAQNPHKLLRAMGESLSHYSHHGSRTNKDSLGDMRESGVGTPTLLVIDATETDLIPGTDYDDHFLLGEPVDPSNIMGTVDLVGRKPNNPLDVAAVTTDVLEVINEHIDNQEVTMAS